MRISIHICSSSTTLLSTRRGEQQAKGYTHMVVEGVQSSQRGIVVVVNAVYAPIVKISARLALRLQRNLEGDLGQLSKPDAQRARAWSGLGLVLGRGLRLGVGVGVAVGVGVGLRVG